MEIILKISLGRACILGVKRHRFFPPFLRYTAATMTTRCKRKAPVVWMELTLLYKCFASTFCIHIDTLSSLVFAFVCRKLILLRFGVNIYIRLSAVVGVCNSNEYQRNIILCTFPTNRGEERAHDREDKCTENAFRFKYHPFYSH